MSFHFYLYRAPDGLGPVNDWSDMQALPLGTADEVKERLAALFPEVSWQRREAFWVGLGRGVEPYLDILLSETETGNCRFVVLNKAAPSTMRRVMEALHLNYACAPEAGDLVDPYAYEDGDRYYAKKPAPRR